MCPDKMTVAISHEPDDDPWEVGDAYLHQSDQPNPFNADAVQTGRQNGRCLREIAERQGLEEEEAEAVCKAQVQENVLQKLKAFDEVVLQEIVFLNDMDMHSDCDGINVSFNM